MQNPNARARTSPLRMLRTSLTIGYGFGLVLYSATARAEAPRRFALQYQGGTSCPSEAQVLTEVQRRAPKATLVLEGQHEVSARLSVETNGERQRGTVDIESLHGLTHREIEGADCAQVVRALSLIVAIAIDSDATAAEESARASASPATVRVTQSPEPSLRRRSPTIWWAVGAGLGVTGGVAPDPSLTETVQFELGRGHDAGLSANVGLSGVHARGSVNVGTASADFDLLALRISSCPYRVGSRVALNGCVSFDWGRLRGRGSRATAAQASSAVWSGPGSFIAAEWRALPPIRLELQLGALLPLARDRFYFGPNQTVYRIPDVAGYGGLNVLVGE